MSDKQALAFRVATPADVESVVGLINGAYRGDHSRKGWTSEADLVEGDRVTPEELGALILSPDTVILLCLLEDSIIGTVELRNQGEEAYLGMLVVNPSLQASGIGKRLVAAAEELVQTRWHSSVMVLSVISVRVELIAFYERRGYSRTGMFEDFPAQLGQSSPIIAGLQFEQLSKSLA